MNKNTGKDFGARKSSVVEAKSGGGSVKKVWTSNARDQWLKEVDVALVGKPFRAYKTFTPVKDPQRNINHFFNDLRCKMCPLDPDQTQLDVIFEVLIAATEPPVFRKSVWAAMENEDYNSLTWRELIGIFVRTSEKFISAIDTVDEMAIVQDDLVEAAACTIITTWDANELQRSEEDAARLECDAPRLAAQLPAGRLARRQSNGNFARIFDQFTFGETL